MRATVGVLLSSLLLVWSSISAAALIPPTHSNKPAPPGPRPLHSGYFDIDRKPGSSLFYAFWEAASPTDAESAPILLWLQGGPGCASTFGAFYELGPLLVSGDNSSQLQPNNYSWHSSFGLLVIDQPIGEHHAAVLQPPTGRDVLCLLLQQSQPRAPFAPRPGVTLLPLRARSCMQAQGTASMKTPKLTCPGCPP